METKTKLAQWLEGRLRSDHLSLRQAAEKTGLSHATIADILRGVTPHPETIIKLANAFSESGDHHKLALEDKLLILAGYRTPRPEEELNELVAQLLDKVKPLSEPQLEMMINFADFLVEIER